MVVRPGALEITLESCEELGLCLVAASPQSSSLLVIVHLVGPLESDAACRDALHALELKHQQAVDQHRYSDAAVCYSQIVDQRAKMRRHDDQEHQGCETFSVSPMPDAVMTRVKQSAAWSDFEASVGDLEVVVMVTEAEWSLKNQMLSGEMKKRRGMLLQAYKDVIDQILV